jgi:DNA-binding transcriptional MerR regulator
MGKYSIKDLEKISGVKAHTIRIWEKRYELIQPCRTSTNIRYYNDAELRRILNISILTRNGFKISRIAKFQDIEISERVLLLTQREGKNEDIIESLVLSMIEFDESRFDRLLSNLVIKLGFEDTLIKVLVPFFERVGILWQTGTIVPAQEHFVSNLVRQKLLVAIDGQRDTPSRSTDSYLLFLPDGEMHELGLLFINYLLRRRGYFTTLIGQATPLSDLSTISNNNNFNNVIISITLSSLAENAKEIIEETANHFKSCRIMVTGPHTKNFKFKIPQNVILIQSYEDFISKIEPRELTSSSQQIEAKSQHATAKN